MIRMRDDDVLVPSSTWSDPFGRFRQVHEWIRACPGMIHVPTVLIEGTPNSLALRDYPECVEYLRRETAEGHMEPQLHGMFHVDYAPLSFRDVYDHLGESIEWMLENLAALPTKWYTPWGADTEMLRLAAKAQGLELIGVDRELQVGKVTARVREGMPIPTDAELSFHWWEGGARVKRLARAMAHGGWENARQAEPDVFRD